LFIVFAKKHKMDHRISKDKNTAYISYKQEVERKKRGRYEKNHDVMDGCLSGWMQLFCLDG